MVCWVQLNTIIGYSIECHFYHWRHLTPCLSEGKYANIYGPITNSSEVFNLLSMSSLLNQWLKYEGFPVGSRHISRVCIKSHQTKMKVQTRRHSRLCVTQLIDKRTLGWVNISNFNSFNAKKISSYKMSKIWPPWWPFSTWILL